MEDHRSKGWALITSGPVKKLVHAGTSMKVREEILRTIETKELIAFESSFDFVESIVPTPQGLMRNAMVLPSLTVATERVKIYAKVDTILFIDDLEETDQTGYREFRQIIDNAFQMISETKARRSGIVLDGKMPKRG